jgi:hypothetical protein
LDPATPANLGAACINTPKATGWLPTGIVVITVFVAASITDTVLAFRLAAYALLLSRLTATPTGVAGMSAVLPHPELTMQRPHWLAGGRIRTSVWRNQNPQKAFDMQRFSGLMLHLCRSRQGVSAAPPPTLAMIPSAPFVRR